MILGSNSALNCFDDNLLDCDAKMAVWAFKCVCGVILLGQVCSGWQGCMPVGLHNISETLV